MEDRNLSLSAVAGSLGVSERTVRRWIKSGKLKAYKPGRDYRIPESALRELVEESEVFPKAQSPLPLEYQQRAAGIEVGKTVFVPLEEGEEPDTVTLQIHYVRLLKEGEPFLQAMREASPEEAAKIREELAEKAGQESV
jgi:excisionase family DNA binding protein